MRRKPARLISLGSLPIASLGLIVAWWGTAERAGEIVEDTTEPTAADAAPGSTDHLALLLRSRLPDAGDDALGARLARARTDLRRSADLPPSPARRTALQEATSRLGEVLVVQARRSHDARLYDLVLRCADVLEDLERHPQGLLLRGLALHESHQFARAERVARELVERRGHCRDHGLLGDVLLDLGRVAAASRSYQRMIDLRPCLQSYARGARIRWMSGDIDGCHELLGMACRSGSRRAPEALAWALTELARIELHRGDPAAASRVCEHALQVHPGSARAAACRARIGLARGDVGTAVADARQALAAHDLPEYAWLLIETLERAGETGAAARQRARLAATGAFRDPRHFALYLLAQPEPDVALAVAMARAEHEQRQDVHTEDLLAWASFHAGDLEAAREWSERALRHGTPEPRFQLHAAAIALAQHRLDAARDALDRIRVGELLLMPSERDLLDDLRRRL